MKTMKSFLILLTLLSSATFYGSAISIPVKEDPLSEEIHRMLSGSSLIIEEDLTVRVIFSVTEDNKIEIRSISTAHAGLKSFLEARLNGQQLEGNNWYPNGIYELPVRVKAVR